MADLTLYVNKSAATPADAVVASQFDPSPREMPDFVLGDKIKVELIIVDDSGIIAAESTSGSYTAAIAVGAIGSTSYFCYSSTFTTSSDGRIFTLDLNTTELDTAIGSAASISSFFEYQITDGSGNARTLVQAPITCRNEIIDPAATVPAPKESYYTSAQSRSNLVWNNNAITGLTGGTATDLDGIDTAGGLVTTGTVTSIRISGVEYVYELVGGTDAEASPSIVRPDDYAASTNERVWKLLEIKTNKIHAAESAGLILANSGGTTVLTAGPGGGTGLTAAGSILTPNRTASAPVSGEVINLEQADARFSRIVPESMIRRIPPTLSAGAWQGAVSGHGAFAAADETLNMGTGVTTDGAYALLRWMGRSFAHNTGNQVAAQSGLGFRVQARHPGRENVVMRLTIGGLAATSEFNVGALGADGYAVEYEMRPSNVFRMRCLMRNDGTTTVGTWETVAPPVMDYLWLIVTETGCAVYIRTQGNQTLPTPWALVASVTATPKTSQLVGVTGTLKYTVGIKNDGTSAIGFFNVFSPEETFGILP